MPLGFSLKLGGKTTVTTAGTRVQLTSSGAHENLHDAYIEADEDNTGKIYVGDVTVTSDKYLTVLSAGEGISVGQLLGITGLLNATTIYLDASANTQSVQWGYI